MQPRENYHFAFLDWFYRLLLVGIALLFLLAAFLLTARKAPAADIALMNAKLSRYVHPTGKCANEQLATLYGNGDGHVGKPVACGGRLDTTKPIVAHKSLPCGTRLTLTNPRNGLSTTAIVFDRGPYTSATLDLGPAVTAALKLNTSSYVCVQ